MQSTLLKEAYIYTSIGAALSFLSFLLSFLTLVCRVTKL